MIPKEILKKIRQIELRTLRLVNETMAAQYWRNRNPIGERLQVKGRWMQVIGVAKDSKYQSVRETPKPFFYVPLRQNFSREAGGRCSGRGALRQRICRNEPVSPQTARDAKPAPIPAAA